MDYYFVIAHFSTSVDYFLSVTGHASDLDAKQKLEDIKQLYNSTIGAGPIEIFVIKGVECPVILEEEPLRGGHRDPSTPSHPGPVLHA